MEKNIQEKKSTEKKDFSEALSALKKGDAESFGALIDKNTKKILKKASQLSEESLILSALATKDATGCGLTDDGGIYSIVKKDKVDGFIHNTSAWHRKFFGGTPEFYVTELSNSGVFVKKD